MAITPPAGFEPIDAPGRIVTWGDSLAVGMGQRPDVTGMGVVGAGFGNARLPSIDSINPNDTVVMSVGTNDMGMDPDAYAERLRSTVTSMRERGATPVLTGVVRGRDPRLDAIDDRIQGVTRSMGVPYAPNGAPDAPDGIHFSRRGYQARLDSALSSIAPPATPPDSPAPEAEAPRYRSDDAMWSRLIRQESGGRQSAVSPAGAVGVAQIMPTTGPEAARLADLPWDQRRLRVDRDYNESLGRAYFDAQLERFGDPRLALAAYNAGPGRVQRELDKGGSIDDVISRMPAETRTYVRNISGGSDVRKMTTRSSVAPPPGFEEILVPAGFEPIDAPTDVPAEERPSLLGLAGQAALRGGREAITNISQAPTAFQDREPTPPGGSGAPEVPEGALIEPHDEVARQMQRPISEGWRDPRWWATQMAYGLGSTAPAAAAGIAGGAAGSVAGPAGALVGGAAGAGSEKYTAPNREVKPYTGDYKKYGFGPEHNFFVDAAPPQPAAAPVQNGFLPGLSNYDDYYELQKLLMYGGRLPDGKFVSGPFGESGIPYSGWDQGSQWMRGGGNANGGIVGYANGGGISGLVDHASGGRADEVVTSVPAGTFIIPADVVSALGDGNTDAGARALDAGFARLDGGESYQRGGNVPVRLSGGEYRVPPQVVMALGGGDIGEGTAILDRAVKDTRKRNIKRLKKLPPPKV